MEGMPPHIFPLGSKFYAHMAINWHMAAESLLARATNEMNEQTTCLRDIASVAISQRNHVQHLQPSNAFASSKQQIEEPLILC